jgi:hypothetical protein
MIDGHLLRRRVKAFYTECGHPTKRIYKVHRSQLYKLPVWKHEPYLPVEEGAGHGIYNLNQGALAALQKFGSKKWFEYDWKPVEEDTIISKDWLM